MRKRKIIVVCLALCMLLCMGAALADSPTVRLTPLDYQTGKAVSKTYVENELFRLRVDIDIPRFADLANLQLLIETDGVEIDEHNVLLQDGEYYIIGVVTDQPAALCVKIKDTRYDTAQTAEELYNALQSNKTISATYYFYGANRELTIPKTGGASIVMPAVCILGIAALCAAKRR